MFITNDNLKLYTSDTKNEEATYFALCILMPKNIFIKKFNNLEGKTDYKIQRLAYYFGVSKLAVYIRANTLGLINI